MKTTFKLTDFHLMLAPDNYGKVGMTQSEPSFTLLLINSTHIMDLLRETRQQHFRKLVLTKNQGMIEHITGAQGSQVSLKNLSEKNKNKNKSQWFDVIDKLLLHQKKNKTAPTQHFYNIPSIEVQ